MKAGAKFRCHEKPLGRGGESSPSKGSLLSDTTPAELTLWKQLFINVRNDLPSTFRSQI